MDKIISQMFEAAAEVANEWSLAAFAIAALVSVVLWIFRKKTSLKNATPILGVIVIAMVVLAALPLIARAYLENHGVYRLRITVEDPHGMPLDDAKVTSSIGGEPKRVEGGWEFDIPAASKPTDGKLTIYGEVASAFLSGKTDVELSNDYNPSAKVRLNHDRSARIRGRVVDRSGNPIAATQVSVVGYESEAVTTGILGQFNLPAHAADGQQIQLAVFKKGIGSVSESEQAGEQPATIVLGHR
jgi:hypothetical protein